MVDAKTTVAAILAAMASFAIRSRGMLAALGRAILAYGKANSLDTRKAIHDSLETAAQLAGSTFDSALFGKALTCASNAKLATKHGVYEDWKNAASDKEAQDILDKATNKTVKKTAKKSDLSKAIAAVDKLEGSDLETIALHVAKLLEAAKNAAEKEKATTPAESVAA